MKKRLTALSLIALAPVFGQNAPVPPAYQGLYTELSNDLSALTTTVNSQWNGQKGQTMYTSELLNANGSIGLGLLASGARQKYLQELNALKSIGVQAVTVKMGFPMLYQPFLQFNGDPGDYGPIIQFYQQVVADVHAANMKIVVESASIFPGFFSAGSGLNIAGYYKQLTYTDYLTGVATINNTISTQIRPDFLNVGSEPTTEVQNTGYQVLGTPSGWASAVQAYQSMLPVPHPIPVGAGVGTWETSNGSDFIAALIPVVDYIDLHIYPVTTPPNSSVSIPNFTISLIDQAEQAGKRVAISEAWLYKVAQNQYNTSTVATSQDTYSLDSYSFWAPLDQEFLADFYGIANWKKLIYFSGFWSRYYWGYVDYGQSPGLQTAALINQSIAVAKSALDNNQLTSTGSFVKNLVQASPAITIVNGASYNTTAVAPNSILSIFGTGLATGTASAGSSLGTSLSGTSINVVDSAGKNVAASLFYVSPTQVNALLPAGLAPGLATATVTPGSGPAYTGTLNIVPSAPGLFSENGSAAGVASAQIFTVGATGAGTYTPVFTGSGPFTTAPINVNVAGSSVYLILYGTGIEGRSSVGNVTASVNGVNLPVSFAGPQGSFAGLDQVNILLPPSLAGTGTVNVILTVDGLVSNTVQVQFQ